MARYEAYTITNGKKVKDTYSRSELRGFKSHLKSHVNENKSDVLKPKKKKSRGLLGRLLR